MEIKVFIAKFWQVPFHSIGFELEWAVKLEKNHKVHIQLKQYSRMIASYGKV